MKTNQLKNKKILILGFGREGSATLKYLLKKKIEAQKITVADQNRLEQFHPKYRQTLKKNKVNLQLGKNYLKGLDEFEVIIKTPGLKLDDKLITKLEKKCVEITSGLNLFLAEIKGKIVGVTGTKGKSTTASLIYEILKAAGKKVVLVGNIGKPFLDYLNQDSNNTIFVAELSSYQLDTIKGKIDAGVITSFFPEHLNYHGNVKKYLAAKMNLAKLSKIVFYNQKYKVIKDYLIKNKIKSQAYQAAEVQTNLLGEHNQDNIAAAIEVAKLFKIKRSLILKALKNFKGLEHRLEFVGKYKGINFYNDVLSTTSESSIAAVDALKEKNLQTIIVGGFDRGLNYKKLAQKIIESNIQNIIVWPNAGRKIEKEMRKFFTKKFPQKIFSKNFIPVKNMRQTVTAAFKLTQKNATVLLSPAASSYDFYHDYQEKGEEFKKLIQNFNN